MSKAVTDSKAAFRARSSMAFVSQGTKNSLVVLTVNLSQDEKTRVLTKEATTFTDTANGGSSQWRSQDWGLGKCELKT